MSRRTERVGEEIRSEIARLLREEVTDPRIGFVTLTRVEVAPDLGHARVLWSALETQGGPTLEAVEAGLASAAPFLRRRLAAALSLRRTPEIQFRRDPSLVLGGRTLELLHEIEEPGDGEA
jgi:ribosome-binding factor A